MSFDEIGYKANNKICRLCLKSCENSIPIFDEASTILEKPLKQCLEDIARISLSPLDNLPETVCQPCYKTFTDSYSVVLRIRKNDEFLHNIVQFDYVNDDNSIDVASSSDQVLSKEAIETIKEHPIHADYVPEDNFDNNTPEEGELLQYIEIAYIQPEAEASQNEISSNNPCSYCPKTFSSMRYKRDHERRHFEDGRKCPHCDRSFLKKCDWTRHLNSHTLEKTFKCSVCSKIFFSLAELNRHMKVHNSAREHKCEYCHNKYKDITALKFHIRSVHFKERPYCCPNCGSAFSTASKVRRHQKSKICSETKSITTVHHGCEEEFLIFENKYEVSNCVESHDFILDNGSALSGEESFNDKIDSSS